MFLLFRSQNHRYVTTPQTGNHWTAYVMCSLHYVNMYSVHYIQRTYQVYIYTRWCCIYTTPPCTYIHYVIQWTLCTMYIKVQYTYCTVYGVYYILHDIRLLHCLACWTINCCIFLYCVRFVFLQFFVCALHCIFLPARRYASAGYSDRNVSVCLSVRLSRTGIVSKRS